MEATPIDRVTAWLAAWQATPAHQVIAPDSDGTRLAAADLEAVLAGPTYPELVSSRHLEAHLLVDHGHDFCSIPHDVRTLAWLRQEHATLHREGAQRFPHAHAPIDVPEPSGALDAGTLSR